MCLNVSPPHNVMSPYYAVNPHENRRSLAPSGSSDQSTATESSEKRRSVADILDEEFSKMETGDTRANSYKYAGLSDLKMVHILQTCRW